MTLDITLLRSYGLPAPYELRDMLCTVVAHTPEEVWDAFGDDENDDQYSDLIRALTAAVFAIEPRIAAVTGGDEAWKLYFATYATACRSAMSRPASDEELREVVEYPDWLDAEPLLVRDAVVTAARAQATRDIAFAKAMRVEAERHQESVTKGTED